MTIAWRTRWIALAAAVVLAVGVFARQEPLALAALVILFWIALAWLRFSWRTLASDVVLTRAARSLNGQQRSTQTLVFDSDLTVEVQIDVAPQLNGLRFEVQDVLPAGCSLVQGSPRLVADVDQRALRWRYELRGQMIGRTSLPGLAVTITDLEGLFRVRRFVPLRQELVILPYLIRPQATTSVLKRQNVQMLAGTHGFRQPGSSTELLGIREYQRGDPPRSIAWKPTARLDRLMTCQYESEVPIRATIVADLSPEQYRGRPGPAPADGIMSATASVARLLMADGDPVAAMLVSRTGRSWLPHGLGERHLTRLIWHLLAGPAQLAGELQRLPTDVLTQLAWTAAYRRFPELFEEPMGRLRFRRLLRAGRRRQLSEQRLRLVLTLATVHRRPFGAAVRMLADERMYRDDCCRLVEEHPSMAELPRGAATSAGASNGDDWSERMAQELLAAVARAHDNELMVMVGGSPTDGPPAEQLLEAVRVARAAYHRVFLIHVPSSAPGPPAATDDSAAMDRWRQRLAPLGVQAARLNDPRMLEHLVAEIELLRAARARSGTLRR